MPGFDHSVLTDVGWDALADALSGKTLQFIHMEAGDGTVVDDTEMQGLTALKHEVMNFPITSFSDDGQGQVTLIGTLNSRNNPGAAFYFKELGVKVTVAGGSEILYCVANSFAQADYIPAANDTATVIESMQIVVKIDRSVTFVVNVVPGGDVTAQNIGPDTAGAGLFRDKIGDILNFKRLVSTTGSVRWTVSSDTVSADVLIPAQIPSGGMMDYGGLVNPAGWLLCNGTIYNKTDYPDLSAILGNRFGGDGTTTFAVPDCRGRSTIGAGLGTGLTSRAVGDKGGAETCILTVAQLPSHNHAATQAAHAHSVSDPTHAHSISDPNHNHSIANSGNGATSIIIGQWDTNVDMTGTQQGYGRVNSGWPNAGQATLLAATTRIGIYAAGTGIALYNAQPAITVGATGSGQAHSIMSPYLVVNKIIKT